MKNLKKLFAGVAIVAMLASSVPTTVLGAASYSEELEGAYDYAYANGITTQSSIDTADMYGSLTRIAMAKMMANFAIEVLGQTPDTTLDCSFPDVTSELDEQYDNGVTNACQLGLMGVGIENFNPYGLVTRAEFGTVLSRALYGDTYNDGDPYYVNHLNALKDAGIMNNIDNPSALEVRGYVMLMMQRGSVDSTPDVCETPENVLACSLELETCPTECQNVEVKEGTLTVSSVGVDYTSIPMAGLVSFGSIKLAADTDVTVNSIAIKMQGLANLTGSYRVYLEKDGVRISSRSSFSDNVATVSFTTPLVVKSSETFEVIMELNETTAGDEIQLVSTDISSSAQTVNGSFSSASLRTADYTVLPVNVAAANTSALTQKVDDSKLVELGQLNITKSDSTKAAIVKALTVNNSGSAELNMLSDVAVYRDDVKVSTKTTVGARTISFVLEDEIKNTTTSAVSYVIKGKIVNADRLDDAYNFYLRNKEDVTVIEKDTLFRASITATVPSTMALITIVGGDLRFNEATVSSQTLVPGTRNVVFYDGSLQALQGITFDGLTITATAGTGFDKLLSNLYLKVGSSIIAVDEIANVTGESFFFDGQVTVNGTVPFQIYGDLKTDAPATTINSWLDVTRTTMANLEYVDNGQPVTSSIGSIAGRNLTISPADLALSNSSASSKNVQRGDRNIEMANLEFSTTSDVVSKVYSFKADVSGTDRQLFDGAQVTVYDANGTALVSDTINTGSSDKLSFVLPNYVTVAKGTPAKFTVKLDQVPNAVSDSGKTLVLTFNHADVNAKEIINQTSLTPADDVTGTTVTSVVGGTPTIVNQSYTNDLVKYGSTDTLGSIKIKAVNADVVLKDMMFELTGLIAASGHMNKISAVKLYEDGVEIATLTKTGIYLQADDVNKTIALGTTKTYEVKAAISAINTNTDVLPAFKLVLASSSYESTYGSALSTNLTGNVSANVTAVNEIPTVTAVSATTKGNNVIYKITLASTKETTLSGVKLSILGTNLSGGSAALNGLTGILSSDDLGTTDYATALVASNTLTLGGLSDNLVSVMGTRDIFVILENAVILSTTDSPATVRVSLTDMSYNDVFEDDTKSALNGMLAGYQTLMAGSLDLTSIATIN